MTKKIEYEGHVFNYKNINDLSKILGVNIVTTKYIIKKQKSFTDLKTIIENNINDYIETCNNNEDPDEEIPIIFVEFKYCKTKEDLIEFCKNYPLIVNLNDDEFDKFRELIDEVGDKIKPKVNCNNKYIKYCNRCNDGSIYEVCNGCKKNFCPLLVLGHRNMKDSILKYDKKTGKPYYVHSANSYEYYCQSCNPDPTKICEINYNNIQYDDD